MGRVRVNAERIGIRSIQTDSAVLDSVVLGPNGALIIKQCDTPHGHVIW